MFITFTSLENICDFEITLSSGSLYLYATNLRFDCTRTHNHVYVLILSIFICIDSGVVIANQCSKHRTNYSKRICCDRPWLHCTSLGCVLLWPANGVCGHLVSDQLPRSGHIIPSHVWPIGQRIWRHNDRMVAEQRLRWHVLYVCGHSSK